MLTLLTLRSKDNHNPKIAKSLEDSDVAVGVTGPSSMDPDSQTSQCQRLEEELRKKSHLGATRHVLMRATFELRKKNTNEVPAMSRPSLIIEKYPELEQPELILNELLIRLNITDVATEGLIEKVVECMKEVAECIEFQGKMEKEEDQANFLISLYQKFKPKNVAKNTPDMVIVKEVLKPLLTEPVSNEHEGARMVLYMGGGLLASAFLVAGKDIQIKVENPSVAKVLTCLMGCYYSWDKTYPTAYNLCLSIFDEYAFGISVKNGNVALKTFRRNFKAWRANKNQNQ